MLAGESSEGKGKGKGEGANIDLSLAALPDFLRSGHYQQKHGRELFHLRVLILSNQRANGKLAGCNGSQFSEIACRFPFVFLCLN